MKYILFTAQQHDGFAMYRSSVSRFNVVEATPWKRDPLAELADAAREAGLRFGFYYAVARDWEPQLTELLTNYGDIGVVWLDAPGETTRKESIALERLVRRLQPRAIVIHPRGKPRRRYRRDGRRFPRARRGATSR